MRMEMNRETLAFFPEFYTLGQLSRKTMGDLRAIYLFSAAFGYEEEHFLVDPPEAAEETMHAALQTLAREGGAMPLADLRYCGLSLSPLEGKPLGAICFVKDTAWTQEERTWLEGVASGYADTLRAEQQRRAMRRENLALNHMMDSTHACIYVSDAETDEILYMSQTLKDDFQVEHPEGQLCWKVFHPGQEKRCDGCPVDVLLQDRSISAYVWEDENQGTGRIYENYENLFRWSDGRLAHLQHSTDVTEARRIYKAAMTDELTGALTRRAGKERLGERLGRHTEETGPLSVCMLDVNGLKAVNDQYGHGVGDELLMKVAGAVHAQLREPEYLMRLSGDEFLAVLPGATQTQATLRMRQALETFDRERPPFFTQETAFCFGVLEVLPAMSVRDVLIRTDKRMYQQKRVLRIRRAEQLLRDGPAAQSDEAFTYDAERLYGAIAASTDSYAYVCNMRTGVFRYPPAMVAEFGLPGEIVPNAAAVWGARVHQDDRRAFLESNQDITDGRTNIHFVEYRAKNVRGEWVWLRCRGYLVRDENGEPCLFAGFITNLGKKNRLDALTGLFNGVELEEDMTKALSTVEPPPLTLMLLGIDGLRRINALHDRAFGDEVIRITAQRLRSLMPPNATVYRMDSDEFAILLRDGAPGAADRLFYMIQKEFDRQQSFDGKRFYCSLSCGCTAAPEDGNTATELIRSAAYALEYAKQRGKNRLERYTGELVELRRRTLEITELLRESVENDFQGFSLCFQPLFSMDREPVGAETLVRWQCDAYGPVGPEEFIPLLEQTGMIRPVGRWILEEALRIGAGWQQRNPAFYLGVNLSYMQLEDAEFRDYLPQAVRRSGFAPKSLVLELTESYLAANMAQIDQWLETLRGMGIRIAMDDFGTGYSSLAMLRTAPIDIAKIDRAFVEGIHTSAFDRAFLRLVVELCGVRGISTCLEGVETEAEFAALGALPLDYIQGFLLGETLPKEEFERRFLL